jgi:hypothetical protein
MVAGKKTMWRQVRAKLTRIQTMEVAKTREFQLNQLHILKEVT